MIEKIRRYSCPRCGYIKDLDENEPIPDHCPACNDGKGSGWKYKGKEIHRC